MRSACSTSATSAVSTPGRTGLERTFAEMSPVVYETMNGPSEFTVTGRFRDWDIFDRLGEIGVPTLVMSGRYDELRPDQAEDIHEGIVGLRDCDIREQLPHAFPRGAGAVHAHGERLSRAGGIRTGGMTGSGRDELEGLADVTACWQSSPSVSFRATTADDYLVIERFARMASSNPAHYSERWGRMGDFGIIAESDGQPVGAAWARLFAWSDLRDPLGSPQFPEVAVAVDSPFRGRGVGTALLRELLVAGGRLGYVALDLLVERSNFAAIAVYNKLGFKRVGGDARLWMRAAIGQGGTFQPA